MLVCSNTGKRVVCKLYPLFNGVKSTEPVPLIGKSKRLRKERLNRAVIVFVNNHQRNPSAAGRVPSAIVSESLRGQPPIAYL